MFNFKSRFIFIVFVFLFLFAISYSLSTVFAEDLTITTYYPSPYGSYNQLQSNTLGIGDNNGVNGLTSADVPDPATNPGDVWIAGNVGIGTMTPKRRLDILSAVDDIARFKGPTSEFEITNISGGGIRLNTDGTGRVGIRTIGTSGDDNFIVDLDGHVEVKGSTGAFAAEIINTRDAPSTGGALVLRVNRINNDTSILDLYGKDDRKFYFNSTGNGMADASFEVGGADYAEYFENLNKEIIEKGSIVAIKGGKLKIAKKDDVFIVGVVSALAGFVGNNGKIKEERGKSPEKWTLVALLGQVPVKVKGTINHGDYIELDDKGCGRSAKQWHPNVIGRALECYNSKDVGVIKILLK